MIDIGPNLSNEQFKHDLSQVIDNALINGVKGLILTSTDFKTYQANLKIIATYQNKIAIKTTYGLHPHNVEKDPHFFANIQETLSNPLIAAIGEFGLDYFRMIGSKDKQNEVVQQFLNAALTHPHLGLFLHERGAFDDFYQHLKTFKGNNKSVVHCFTGNKEQVKSYLDLGCYIGVTGWVSDNRRNSDLVDALQYIPLNRLMIETDCPYLTPFNMPKKIRRNEPAFLPYVAKSIAEIKKTTVEAVIHHSTKNSLDFFSLPDYNNSIKTNHQVKLK